MVVLPRQGLPGARAAPAPDLDDVRPLRVEGGDPVEAVAAEVHQPSPIRLVRLHRVEHLQGPVLGMGAGDDDAVRRQQLRPLEVEVVVADHVVPEPPGVHPVEEVEVGIEAVRPAGGQRQLGVPVPRLHVHDRPQAGGVADPGAVAVHVVEGSSGRGPRMYWSRGTGLPAVAAAQLDPHRVVVLLGWRTRGS